MLAVPPIVTNAYVAVDSVDRDLVDAARGMGMTELEILGQVELPLAVPLIFAGLRTAAVFVVATTTISALTGYSGTLGDIINNETSYRSSGYSGCDLRGWTRAGGGAAAGARAAGTDPARSARGGPVIVIKNPIKRIDNGGKMRKRVGQNCPGRCSAGGLGIGGSSVLRSSAASLPGSGKPAVVIGDKNFAEENTSAPLYAQALTAQGYKVTLKDNHRHLGDHLEGAPSQARSTSTRSTPARCCRRSPATRRTRPSATAAYNEAAAYAAKVRLPRC